MACVKSYPCCPGVDDFTAGNTLCSDCIAAVKALSAENQRLAYEIRLYEYMKKGIGVHIGDLEKELDELRAVEAVALAATRPGVGASVRHRYWLKLVRMLWPATAEEGVLRDAVRKE